MQVLLLQDKPQLASKIGVLVQEEWPEDRVKHIRAARDVRKFPVRIVSVLLGENELVGHVKLIQTEEEKEVKICSLVVKRGYRNRGIGRQLIERAEKEAIRRGCNVCTLRTTETLALSFYRAAGYRIDKKRTRKSNHYITDPKSNIWMYRILRHRNLDAIVEKTENRAEINISKGRTFFEDSFVKNLYVMPISWIQDTRYELSALCSILVLLSRVVQQKEKKHVRSRDCPARCSKCRAQIADNEFSSVYDVVSALEAKIMTKQHSHRDKKIHDLQDLASLAKEHGLTHARVISNLMINRLECIVRSGNPILLAYVADTSNTTFRPACLTIAERKGEIGGYCVHFGLIIGVARDSEDNLLAIMQNSSSPRNIKVSWSELMRSNAYVDRILPRSTMSSRVLLIHHH
jgi:ribosomal protein S18 acetylase RimI-like enzyme